MPLSNIMRGLPPLIEEGMISPVLEETVEALRHATHGRHVEGCVTSLCNTFVVE